MAIFDEFEIIRDKSQAGIFFLKQKDGDLVVVVFEDIDYNIFTISFTSESKSKIYHYINNLYKKITPKQIRYDKIDSVLGFGEPLQLEVDFHVNHRPKNIPEYITFKRNCNEI